MGEKIDEVKVDEASSEVAKPEPLTPPSVAQGEEGGTPLPTSQPAGQAEGEVESGTPAPAGEPATQAPKEDWRDRRIAKLTAKLREAEAAKAALPVAEAQEIPDFEKRVSEEAERRTAAKAFVDGCNAAAQAGYAKYGQEKFIERLDALRSMATGPEEQARYNQFLAAGLETGQLHKIIYELGEDPNEADRIMSLSPVKMAVELAKRAIVEPPAAPSALPKPIRPLGNPRGGDAALLDPANPEQAERMDTATWMKAREAQLAKRA